MIRLAAFLLPVLMLSGALVLEGCGRKGPLQPPSAPEAGATAKKAPDEADKEY